MSDPDEYDLDEFEPERPVETEPVGNEEYSDEGVPPADDEEAAGGYE